MKPKNLLIVMSDEHNPRIMGCAGHPVIRSYEPGEDWYWCYLDELAFELEGAPPAPSHP